MILSGERFGILEPREEIFVIDGQVSPGMECTIRELQNCPDQFLPFEKVTCLQPETIKMLYLI
jgi:hypothetical protein